MAEILTERCPGALRSVSVATRKLSTYRRKRDFSKTAEPSGTLPVKPSKQLRYVIQKHAARRLHYDLRLELGGVFKSWAVTRGPSLTPQDKRLAVEVEDHPLDYGDFEGTIPKGQYGGGTVQLWDRGYWQPLGEQSAEEQLRKGELKFVLAGERLQGSWVLVRMKHDREGGKRTNWLLIKHRDEFARDAAATQKMIDEDASVASGRPMSDIAAGKGRAPKPFMLDTRKLARADATWNSKESDASGGRCRESEAAKRSREAKSSAKVPDFIEPELCKLVERPPSGDDWAHEAKLDGYRMQLRVAGNEATLKTRKGLDWTDKFQPIAAARRAISRLHHRRRSRGARCERRAGLLGAAGRAVGRRRGRSRAVRVRPAVSRWHRPAQAAAARAQGRC